MRKLVIQGLLALSVAAFADCGFAGSVDECDRLTDPESDIYAPKMFGLCVAWYNADDDAKVIIGDRFLSRAGFPVPGSVPTPEALEFDCPCWSELDSSQICELGPPTINFTQAPFVGYPDVYVGLVGFAPASDLSEFFSTFPDLSTCSHTVGTVSSSDDFTVLQDAGEGRVCGYELGLIASMHASELCNG